MAMTKAEWQQVIDGLRKTITQMENNLEVNRHFLNTAMGQLSVAPEPKPAAAGIEKK